MKTKHFARAQRIDRLAQFVITAGGITVIVCVIGILLLIAKEAVPLFRAPAVTDRMQMEAGPDAAGDILGIGVGEYLENGFVLTSRGQYELFAIDDGAKTETIAIDPPQGARGITRADAPGDNTFTLLWDSGSVTLERIRFAPRFDEDSVRTIAHEVDRPLSIEPSSGSARVSAQSRAPEESAHVCVSLLENGVFEVLQHTREEDFLGNETVETHETTVSLPAGANVGAYTLCQDGTSLYVGTQDGRLIGWDLSRPGAATPFDDVRVNDDGSSITALACVFGGESIGVADAAGRYTVWSRLILVDGRGEKQLGRIHTLTPPGDVIVKLIASRRDKSLLSITASGRLRMDHATSERLLFELAPESGIVHVGMSRRGNGFVGSDRGGAVRVWDLHNPHPEVSANVLFGKVWYEGYKNPEYMWQSSSASDDFEPKLSLVPLVFGSIKGTLYAMIFAVPLALFGALYTSQLTRPEIRDVVKPVVEVMAAIPSVIIGFLAALWLAPLFERNLGAVFLSLIMLPAVILFTILLWQVLRRWRPLRVIETGYEFLVAIPVLAIGVLLVGSIGPWMESVFFGGDLKQWMFQESGIRYDPRNCIVIAFALGFAVIPIIFTMAEDAFSNVPRSLTAASLAMGASRWQTVWRVVLPSASPGIFAGIVIGLGRAVGETMIVLMATGNTPILDWSPFNGMRTLSANIAVEVPEAPFGGTLYRVLFLSAVILFLMTFVLNTLAELIRQRLRKKYAQFQ